MESYTDAAIDEESTKDSHVILETDEVEHLRKECSGMKDKLKDLEIELSRARSSSTSSNVNEKEFYELKATLTEQDHLLQLKTKDLLEKEAELKILEATLSTRISDHQQEKEGLLRDLDIKETKLSDVKEDLKIKETKLFDVKEDLKIKERELSDVKKDLEIKERELFDVKKDLEIKERELFNVKEDLKIKERELFEMEKNKKLEPGKSEGEPEKEVGRLEDRQSLSPDDLQTRTDKVVQLEDQVKELKGKVDQLQMEKEKALFDLANVKKSFKSLPSTNKSVDVTIRVPSPSTGAASSQNILSQKRGKSAAPTAHTKVEPIPGRHICCPTTCIHCTCACV